MIGGGIFAVLGVVAAIAGGATWAAFVAACAGYSYDRLNVLSQGQGGAVTFVQCFLDRPTLAGMTGWRKEYNHIRPHSSLNNRPPAPEAIQPKSELRLSH